MEESKEVAEVTNLRRVLEYIQEREGSAVMKTEIITLFKDMRRLSMGKAV